jgi:hypothetical protein
MLSSENNLRALLLICHINYWIDIFIFGIRFWPYLFRLFLSFCHYFLLFNIYILNLVPVNSDIDIPVIVYHLFHISPLLIAMHPVLIEVTVEATSILK